MKTLYVFLALFPLFFGAHAQRFPVDTLSKTGPINKRVNIVILGDGFTAAEMPKFIEEAKKFRTFFLSYAPYNRYADYFSFFAIQTPSNQSGATNPGTAPDAYPTQPVETKDTYYGASFGTRIHRLVTPTKFQVVTNVLAANFPAYDLCMMIVNTPWYGGAGGGTAVYTLNASAPLIAVHEVGHSFGRVLDEYWPGGGGEALNMTKTNAPATIRWKNWLGRENTGIFEHTGAGATGWYKPTTGNCLMELLSKQNCAVCREAAVDKILRLVSPIEANTPNGTRTVIGSAAQPFSVKLLKPTPNSLLVEWRVDGKLIESNKEQIMVARNQLTTKTATLTMSVFDSTGLTQTESTRTARTYTVSWPLEKPDLPIGPALLVTKSVLCAGESTVLSTSGCAGTLAWSGGQTTASVSVTPIQTTAYTVKCTTNGTISEESMVTVTVNPLPDARASGGGNLLEEDPIRLTASGGTTYSWSGPGSYSSVSQNPTIANAQLANAGTYTVRVTSAAGCSKEAQTVVSVGIRAPTITVNSLNICPNDRVTLSTSGCVGGTVRWSNGVVGSSQTQTLTQATTFTAVCEKGGLTSGNSNSLLVNVKPGVTATANSKGTYLEGEKMELTATGGGQYRWTGPNNFTSNQQNPAIAVVQIANAGTYTVVVTSAEGCAATATTEVRVDRLLATEPLTNEQVVVYPNPTTDMLTIAISSPNRNPRTVELLDVQGRSYLRRNMPDSTLQISLRDLPAGMYYLRLEQGEETIVKQVMKH